MKLKPWLNSVINAGEDDGMKANEWVAINLLKNHTSDGLYCQINDGLHRMEALISSNALSAFERKRNLDWQNLHGCRIVCKEFQLRSIQEDCFQPYLFISSFDSPGGCGSTEIVDDLEVVSSSKGWKAKGRRVAFEKFNSDSDLISDIKCFTEAKLDANSMEGWNKPIDSAQDSWGATPVIYSQDSWGASPMIYIQVEGTEQDSWGETPVFSQTEKGANTEKDLDESPHTSNIENAALHSDGNINLTGNSKTSGDLDNEGKSKGEVDNIANYNFSRVEFSSETETECETENNSSGSIQRNTSLKEQSDVIMDKTNTSIDFTSLPGCSKSFIDNAKKYDISESQCSSPSVCPLRSHPLRSGSRDSAGYPYVNLPGCKHNSAKKCYLCFTRTVARAVPESLYLAAKSVNFKCQCKKR